MSTTSDSEKKQYAIPQVYYFPQAVPMQGIPMQTTSVNNVAGDEALARSLQAQENSLNSAPIAQPEEGGCRFRSFFRRRCGRYSRLDSNGGCCMRDDGRPLGDITSFIHGLVFGMFVPIFSVMAVFGFESKKLSRTGVLLGNANFFFILAVLILSGVGGMHGGRRYHQERPGGDIVPPFIEPNATAVDPIAPTELTPTAMPETSNVAQNNMRPDDGMQIGEEGRRGHNKERKGCHFKGKKLYFAIPAFVLALIFFIVGKKSACSVMAAYRARGDNKTEEETVKVFSEAGTCKNFAIGFIVSFLLPVIGTGLALILGRKYLRTRYGAFIGLAVHTFISGIFAHRGHGAFLMLFGLVLFQIASVHFRRAIATAVAKQGASQC